MKKQLLLFILIVVSKSLFAQNTIELPLTYKEGYGPFPKSYLGAMIYSDNNDNPWKKTELKTQGVPKEWENAKFGHVTLNMYQSVYQDFLQGNISDSFYEVLQESWSWGPDTLKLSKKPIRTSIAFVRETDSLGNCKMIIDANNNLDFSDDKVFTPSSIYPSNDTEAKELMIMVEYDKFVNGKVVTKKSPIVLIPQEKQHSGAVMHNFPEYAVAEFNGEEIAICSDDFCNPFYENITMVLLTDTLKHGGKAEPKEILEDYLIIKGKRYKSKGIDPEKNVLVLEEVESDKDQIYSTQIGFKAPLFSTEDFITKDSIALEDFRGKYLYLDFWALWCGPCIAELPHLKKLYDKVDKSQIEFLGIVESTGNDEGKIKELIDKNSVNWTHIISNKKINITELYNVRSFPTTILLDKEGRVIAKNIRSEELEQKLKELLK